MPTTLQDQTGNHSATSGSIYCLVQGDNRAFSVEPHHGDDVTDLKKLVRQARANLLQGVDFADLELWKLREPELVDPHDTLVTRIQSRGDVAQFADRLGGYTTDEMSKVFPQDPSKKHLHILVQLLPTARFSNAQPAGHPEVDIRLNDAAVNSIVYERLSGYRNAVKAYLRKTPYYPTWQPKSLDKEIVQHVSDLAIPNLHDQPSLLLHPSGVTIDPEVISTIFGVQSSDIRLINTSGSGKTRVLIDGLRKHWGFYLTCSVSGRIGSTDMMQLMDLAETRGFTETLPSSTKQDSPELRRNRNLASHLSSQILLARLFVFRLFLEEAHALRANHSLDFYRDRWVYFQLLPTAIGHGDIFREITSLLNKANDDYLENVCGSLSVDIRSKYLPSEKLYIVVDEAQEAARKYPNAFRYYTDENQCRPLLQCIMRTFDERHIGPTIISGTGLSTKIVCQAIQSRIFKVPDGNWTVNKVGAFDSEPAQRNYIEQYLPPRYADTPSGKALLTRAWDWLRGRHRFTASFVQLLLTDSFCSPHKLLNESIRRVTGMNPSDSPPFANDEPDIVNEKLLEKLSLMSFEKLMDDPKRVGRLGEIICSWILHQRVIPLREEEKDWVEWGFARFVESNTTTPRKVHAVIDEPLIIFAAANHLAKTTAHGLVDKVLDSMSQRGGKGEHFEDWLVVYFSLAFGPGVALRQVFDFGDNVPDWAQIEGVHLLAMSSDGEGHKTNYSPDDTTGIPIALCCDSQTAPETVEWFENPDTVMCLPDVNLGPDIVFFVGVPGRGTICIIVQSRYRSQLRLDKRMQEDANSTLEPSDFYRKKNLTAPKWEDYRTRITTRVSKFGTIDDTAWFPDNGVRFLRVLASWPAEDRGCEPPIVSLNMDRVLGTMDKGNLLADMLDKETTRKLKRKHIERDIAARKHVEAEGTAREDVEIVARARKRRRGL